MPLLRKLAEGGHLSMHDSVRKSPVGLSQDKSIPTEKTRYW
jgi:hypothetical protein